MRQRIAFAVFLIAVVVGTGALAACPTSPAHSKTHKTSARCLDLSALPQISANIVGTQPTGAPKAAAPINLDDQFYTGPKVGLTKPEPGVKPTPTVGYHWSLD